MAHFDGRVAGVKYLPLSEHFGVGCIDFQASRCQCQEMMVENRSARFPDSVSYFVWLILGVVILAAFVIYEVSLSGPMTETNSAQTSAHRSNVIPDRVDPANGQSQPSPQGPTGPINTTTGGASAANPQGETPAGMQAAPQGSSEKNVAPPK
jgi:hypothetical protein